MPEGESAPLIFRMPERYRPNREEDESGRFCLQEFSSKSHYLVRNFLGNLSFFI